MTRFNVTYFLGDQPFIEKLSESQLKNLERRIELGIGDERILNVEEIKEKSEGEIIAETTIQQLGGYGKLKAMINAQFFRYDEKGTLTFQFSGFRKAKYFQVELTPMDVYIIRFLNVDPNTFEATTVYELNGVYAEDLKRIFEEYTGLYLSL